MTKKNLHPSVSFKNIHRQIDWREVRVGFARRVTNKEQRTFIALMDKYSPVVKQLVSAAMLKFILDRIHLKQHIYQTADALGLTGIHRHIWTSHLLSLIDRGKANKAIKFINRHFQNSPAKNKLDNLAKYLQRFADACHYELDKIQGLPIGSGEVESAHRYIPQKRLKIPGAELHGILIQ